jgi:PAS domain S-box-containing protein
VNELRSLSIRDHLLALAAVAVALFVRWLLDPVIGETLPLVTLFGAVAFAVWIGGGGPALLATITGYVGCAYLFIEPRGALGLGEATNLIGLLAYLFTCALIIVIGLAMRSAQRRDSERHEVLQVTLRSIGDAVITTDPAGRVTYLNGIAESLTGWSLSDAKRQPLDQVFRIVNEESREPAPNPANRALSEGVVVGLANHTVLLARDGREYPIDDSAAPIRDDRGNVAGCVLIFRDVSQQRRAENEKTRQLQSARLLAAIVESSEDAIVSKSLAGIIQSWNGAAERLFGHPAKFAVGRHISLVIPPERIQEEDRIIASLRAGQRIEHFETERLHRDGHVIPVALTISPVYNEAGEVVGASKIVRDISARRHAEQERNKFVTLIQNSTDFIGMCDMDGRPFFINKAGLELVGLDNIEQGMATPLSEFFFPEDRPRVMGEFMPKVLKQGHGEMDVRFRNFKNGQSHWMAYKVVVLKDPAGNPAALATVSQDVTERRRLADHLRKLAGELSEANARKNEFLATLAHELRNPLAPLSNMLEVLRVSDDDPGARRQARDTMDRQLRQLVRLVDDLLDLNRVTHNKLELRLADVELAPIIQQAVEASRPLADAASQKLTLDLPVEPLYLHADPARLAQVFGNLLNNASRYSPEGASINLSVRSEKHDIIVTVRDNGMGIPPGKLVEIFEMFRQLDRRQARSHGGLGIGLTLAKRLVGMHGGDIEARSPGEGRGSEFIVRLPALTRAPALARAPALEATPAPKVEERRRSVLVVDDNKDAAVSLAMLLDLSGNQTHLAHDGEAALLAAEKYRPDVVLLDIGMPRMNGHEVCRRLRQKPWGKDLKVIALTGWGQEQDRRKSEEAGFDGHLVKPVDPATLGEVLATL